MLGRYYVLSGRCSCMVEPRRGCKTFQQTLQQCQVKARIQRRFWRVTVRSWNVTGACQTCIMQWGKDTPPVWQIISSKNVQSRKWNTSPARYKAAAEFL
jgi:hypothetical protein